MTREELEKTPWAISFKKESVPSDYRCAIKYALTKKRMFIEYSTNLNEPAYAIRIINDPDFLMDAKPTREEAEALCKEMGWEVE